MVNPDYKSRLHKKGPRAGYTSMVCRHCGASIPIENIMQFRHKRKCRIYEDPTTKRRKKDGSPISPQGVDRARSPKTEGWKPSGAAEEVVVTGGE